MTQKAKSFYVCSNCGQEYKKWQGKCFNCGQWESIVEFKQPSLKKTARRSAAKAGSPVSLSSCSPEADPRRKTGMEEFDRILGGGMVEGVVMLLGGDPGIGKSTLLLQLSSLLSKNKNKVLYITAEESADQISLRAQRLGIGDSSLNILAETNIETCFATMQQISPHAVIVDSIQTVLTEDMESAPGSVSQVRECAAMLIRYAKQNRCSIFLVGHVTKQGAIAGPRVLEHMVDTVLYFEGDSNYQYRILRSVKNRYGPSGEIALFSMTDQGLKQLDDCSQLFVLNRDTPQIGSAFTAVREGSRMLIVEVQALVNPTHFGLPQRLASGINAKKLALSLAVLERYGGASLGNYDIFFNVAGGLNIMEPAVDLSIAAAVMSSLRNMPIKNGVALVGEVGLGGEVRPVNNMSARLKELSSMGFEHCIVPLPPANADWQSEKNIINFIPLKHIQHIENAIFS